jgi:hypothetical protein
MSFPRVTWRVVIPVVLILLLMVTMLGAVCHHHDGANAANCTLCHMAIEPPVHDARLCGMVLPSAAAVMQSRTFVSRFAEQEIAPRAPPA